MILVYFMILLFALGKGAEPQRLSDFFGSGDADGDTITSPTSTVFLIDEDGDIHSRITETPEAREGDTTQPGMEFTHELKRRGYEEGMPLMGYPKDDEMDYRAFPTPKDPPAYRYTTEDDSTIDIPSTTIDYTTSTTTAYPTSTTTAYTTSATTAYTTSATTVYTTSATTAYTTSATTAYTTSTVIPTTISDEVPTVTTNQMSTFGTTTTMTENTNKSTNQILQMPTAEATPYAERHICTFMDTDLICNEEVVCYGEGEIDCTGDEGMTFIDKISLSSVSEDYSDYDAAEDDTVGTFPPNLVGVITPKKIPFLFNMRSFATTGMDINSTSDSLQDSSSTESSDTTESTSSLPAIATTIDENEDSVSDTTPSADTMEDSYFNMKTFRTGAVSNFELAETTMSTDEKTESVTERTTETITSDYETIAVDETSTMDSEETSTMDSEETSTMGNEETSTMDSEETSAMDSEETSAMDSEEYPVHKSHLRIHARGKRQDIISSESDSSSSSMSMSFHVAALESPKKKLRAKVCRLSGDIVCMPTPTTAMCKGKTVCQATSSTAETAESSSAKGVETWAIVVIVVCGLSGCLTVCLLIYLVVTSPDRYPAGVRR